MEVTVQAVTHFKMTGENFDGQTAMFFGLQELDSM